MAREAIEPVYHHLIMEVVSQGKMGLQATVMLLTQKRQIVCTCATHEAGPTHSHSHTHHSATEAATEKEIQQQETNNGQMSSEESISLPVVIAIYQ